VQRRQSITWFVGASLRVQLPDVGEPETALHGRGVQAYHI
jgi:hypothetical protein